jgi:hypothetical protein
MNHRVGRFHYMSDDEAQQLAAEIASERDRKTSYPIDDRRKKEWWDAARDYEREECAREVERIAWSSPTAEGEWALREAAKVIAAQIRARKNQT